MSIHSHSVSAPPSKINDSSYNIWSQVAGASFVSRMYLTWRKTKSFVIVTAIGCIADVVGPVVGANVVVVGVIVGCKVVVVGV